MTEAETFETAVGISGIWPETPARWSFSALEEVARCPRRYALRRASYPEVWGQPGYPDRAGEAALIGTAIHEGVELVLRELGRAGCTSLAEKRAVEVIRGLGGYSEIAARCLEENLERLALNPRMSQRLSGLRVRLDRRTAEMRRAVQALVSQSPVAPRRLEPSRAQVGDRAVGGRLREGGHPEASLVAEEERFAGRIDLLDD
jgi:PD-(D/E)XK nuclease superfamily